MKKSIKNVSILLMSVMIGGGVANAQEQAKKDTVKAVAVESDRNVMLNAASANSGPRNVNIGLPASVGGTTVLENDLPVVYFFWPEMPFKSWRIDAMTNGVKLLDLGQTAINIGDVGFSVGTYNNLGTDKFGGSIGLNSNHFGLLNGTTNLSGPLTKNGLKFSVGAFVNYDPGTYKVNKNNIDRYYNDQTQLYKVALTQDYRFRGGSGSISAFYKYARSKSMSAQHYAPYKYHLDGSVSEIDGFKIGNDNYMAGQKFEVEDATTGKRVERDALDDYSAESHTFDLIGKNRLDNGLNLNFIVRYHTAKSGIYLPIMTGISEQTYTDDSGNQKTGNLQGVMVLASKNTPVQSLTSLFEVGKKSGNHDWKIGLNQWLYGVDEFVTEGATYKQTVEANPKRVGGYNYGISEYHNGTENKTALFLTDKWDISEVLTVNLGARFEYQNLRGDFINKDEVNKNIPYLSNKRTDIKKDWFNKAFMVSGVYKMTKNFGLLGEATYNEQAGHLENYSAGNEPNLKKSKIPGAGLGVFYNHSLFSLVSKATYIQRDEYRSTVNFTSKKGEVERALALYDIETVGWTTDVVATPFKNFNLHFLLTLQAPKYKNYAGTVNFKTGESVSYDFNDNTVTGVSKVLMEIDPSYQWKNLRLWASARYFSKEYSNLTNSLFFRSRWETFAGANYTLNKNLEFSASVVNLLNQRGAKGSISGADLYTREEAAKMEGAILSGTYIRPFTVEFGVKFRF
ncbi:MAG: TonB-dependent receptor [Prevotellaceae bacterium]|nr:TonB-dependent receptor [Prevotellaceae bacterium]